jgi:hypothetical protein
MSRAVGGGRGGLVRAPTPFSSYSAFYGHLGTPKPSGITPTKFELGFTVVGVASNGDMQPLGTVGGKADFARPGGVTVDVGDIPTDITCSALIFYIATGNCVVEFPYPHDETTFESSHINMDIPNGFQSTLNGTTAHTTLSVMDPGNIRNMFSLTSAPDIKPVNNIIYGGSASTFYMGAAAPLSEIIGNGSEIGSQDASTVVVPFTPISIPSTASSVTFEVSWNLDGIIQEYTALNPSAQGGTDLFILRDKWWEGLHIKASVQ